MAMTLLMRPYVVAARFFPLFQAAKPFISHSISFCKTPVGGSSYVGTKLQIHEGLSYYGYKLGGGRRFTTRATQVNDSGSIDSPLMQSMEKKIKEDLNAELVTVKDAYGDGRHVRRRRKLASRPIDVHCCGKGRRMDAGVFFASLAGRI